MLLHDCRHVTRVLPVEIHSAGWQAAHYGDSLIQVMLRKCDRPALIAPFPYISFSGKTEEQKRKLLVDGKRPLINPPQQLAMAKVMKARFKDPGMTSLLAVLLTDADRGMCLCTSRLPLTDLDIYATDAVLKMDLENLSETDGAQYLRLLGVPGADTELRAASREFGNHALALTPLGHYLANRGQLGEIASQFAEAEKGGRARRVIRRYEQVYQGRPELAVLRLLGLFDRPADPGAIAVPGFSNSSRAPSLLWNHGLVNDIVAIIRMSAILTRQASSAPGSWRLRCRSTGFPISAPRGSANKTARSWAVSSIADKYNCSICLHRSGVILGLADLY